MATRTRARPHDRGPARVPAPAAHVRCSGDLWPYVAAPAGPMLARMVKSPPRSVVFLADSVEVEGTNREVEDRLREAAPTLVILAGDATTSGETGLVTLGPALGEHVLGVPAKVHLGPRWTRGGSAAIAIRWEAAVLDSLFPILDGTLVITAAEERSCCLAIEASYRPPLDAFGAFVDRVLLHRVAELTVHEFLERLAGAMSVGVHQTDAHEPGQE